MKMANIEALAVPRVDLGELVCLEYSIDLDDMERHLLKRLSLFNARGRYLSQVHWQTNAPKVQPHAFDGPTLYWHPYEDEDLFNGLLAKFGRTSGAL
jgi:hypothetical protein